jgi:N-acetylneuraminic acid mutarotase/fibronectin type 3 domain-containing protein
VGSECRALAGLFAILLLSVPAGLGAEKVQLDAATTITFREPVFPAAIGDPLAVTEALVPTGENEWRGAARPLGRLRHAMAYDSRADRMILFGGTSGAADLDDTWTYDSDANTWTNLNPSTRPSARGRHAMAYDARSDRVILFGGTDAGGVLGDTWAYDPNANTWTNLNPSTRPSARYRHAMAYDSQSDRIIVFGGTDVSPFDDTWSYDFESNAWTPLDPATRPAARYRHIMAYDSDSDRVVLFGGSDEIVDLGDTWSYDFNTNTWTNQNPAVGPAPRSYPAAAYDSRSDRLILFGGTGASVLDDTWSYDLNSNAWTAMAPATRPAARSYPAMAYDAQSDRIILFGGTSGSSDLGDTWAYDLDMDAWTDMNPATRPFARSRHSAAYDAGSDRIVLFGGLGPDPLGDTWAYDVDTSRWSNPDPGSPPPARSDSAMAYDSRSDRMILFGGSGTVLLNDTWTYDLDGNRWTQLSPPTAPSARARHAMAYDSQSHRVVLFGGDRNGTLDDTWVYDPSNNTWTNVTPSIAPTPRDRHAMAYDPVIDRVILFGGTGALVFGTWAYDLESNAWEDVDPAPSPSGRYRHTMDFDSRSNRTILFGGNTGTSALDDTWAYDGASRTWTNVSPSSGPLARYRHAAAYDSESDRVVVFGGFSPASGDLGDIWAYDFTTNTWTEVNPATTPSARQLAAAAYDSQSDRAILFGGTGATRTLDDTWAFDMNTTLDVSTNRWQDLSPAVRPSVRSGHAMTYDVQSDRVVLFGGRTGPAALGDTWAYDVNTNRWTNMNPTTAPSPRSGHAMAYDAQFDRVLLFGGSAGSDFFGDTWAYDLNTNTWTSSNPSSGPSARHRLSMVYDSESGRMVLFGGTDATATFDDTWIYDFDANAWTAMNPTMKPSARSRYAMVYDAQSDRVVLFGGMGISSLADTWAYDVNSDVWTSPNPSIRPPPRSDSTVAYDRESDRMILFGGTNGAAVLDDTWAYDFETNAWTNLLPTTKPSARSRHAMAYDSQSDRVVLFGGAGITIALNDTWMYDLNTNAWTNMNPAGKPSARSRHAMAYDVESDRIVLFGGAAGASVLEDTWAYDLNTNTWSNMSPAGPPPARYGHAMAYDAESDRVVLFGGFHPFSAEFADTWAYDANTNTWSSMGPAAPPVARLGHAMAYDSQSDRVLLFGGRNATRVSNETWAYDLNGNAWVLRNPVARPSGRSDHAMAYDAESDRVVLSGGSPSTGLSDETWSYDFEADRWADTKPRSKPTARSQHQMAYDAESDRTVLLGGLPFNDETWWFHHPHLPLAPTSLLAFPGNAEITLAWGAPVSDGGSAIEGYRIYRGIAPGTETFHREIGPVLTFTDTGLTNLVTYFYQVTGVNAAGEGPRSNESFATPTPFVPTAPRELRVTAGNANASLTWTAPLSDGGSPVTNYRIYRGTVSGGETLLLEVGNVTAHLDTGLTNGVMYFYQVSAVNFAGESARSNETSDTPRTTPSAAQSLTARSGDARVTLDWREPASDGGSPVTNYRIYRGTTAGGAVFFVEVDDILSYTDAGLTNGATYYYQVSAVNAIGEGPRSSEVAGAPRTVPTAVRSLEATPGDTTVGLAWVAPTSSGGSPITNYRIYRGESSRTETFLIELGEVLSHTDRGLMNGRVYYYEVTAVNAVGEGPRSNEAATQPDRSAPAAPRSLQALTGDATVTLSWEPPTFTGTSPLAGYNVYRGTASGDLPFLTSVGNVLTYEDTAVMNDITYFYEVAARNEVGEGPRSDEVMARPQPPLDTIDPTVRITSPVPGAVLDALAVTVTGTATDERGVVRVDLSLDGTNWSPATGTTSWSGTLTLVEGSNSIHARAEDAAGNVESTTITVVVQLPGPGLEATMWALAPFIAPPIAIVALLAGFLIWRERRKSPLFRRYQRERKGRRRGRKG